MSFQIFPAKVSLMASDKINVSLMDVVISVSGFKTAFNSLKRPHKICLAPKTIKFSLDQCENELLNIFTNNIRM